MNLLLGIDAGATKTRAVLCNENGVYIGTGLSGPCSPTSQDETEIIHTLLKVIMDAGGGNEQIWEDCKAICIGMAGIHHNSGFKIAMRATAKLPFSKNIILKPDYETAWEAAFVNKPGILVISGTGSVAYGVNTFGQSALCGAWDYLLGDDGSAYWIGHQGMRLALRSADGRNAKTKLLDSLLQFFNIEQPEEINEMFHQKLLTKAELAFFAKEVEKSAISGDKTAIYILRRAGVELALLVSAVARKLEFQGEINIVEHGSVIRQNALVRQSFEEYLVKIVPQAQIINPRFKFEIGPILLMSKLLSTQNQSFIENLQCNFQHQETPNL